MVLCRATHVLYHMTACMSFDVVFTACIMPSLIQIMVLHTYCRLTHSV